MSAVLDLHELHAGYGPFRALFDVSLGIDAGESVALLGGNGAGKTTLARVASGLVEPTAGAVLVDGTDLTGAHPWVFARAGIAHAVEGRSVFASLSVQDNLRLPLQRTHGRRGVERELAGTFEQFPSLARRRDQPAGALSGGEQRMLSIARVLLEGPRLLIADELSLGLAPMIVDDVYAQLARLRAEGTSLLIVEQQIAKALELCDRVVLLEHGAVAWQGPATEAADRVSAAMFDRAGG